MLDYCVAFAEPEDVRPRNSVLVFAEDMRYAKTVKKKINGKEIDVLRGPIIYKAESHNLVVDNGRKTILELLTGLSSTSFLYGSFGSSQANPTDPTQIGLTSELITGGPAQRPLVTDLTSNPLSTGDVVSNISGSNRWSITLVYSCAASDYVGDTMGEYGLHSAQAFPASVSPTVTSGLMLCRFVPVGSSFTKSSASKVTVQWTLAA